MPGPVVALDADVLVPIVACDFLLTAFEHGLYEPVVSTMSLHEVECALLEHFPHLDAAAIQYSTGSVDGVHAGPFRTCSSATGHGRDPNPVFTTRVTGDGSGMATSAPTSGPGPYACAVARFERIRSPVLGPAARPVAIPDDLDRPDRPRATGLVVLPLRVRWSGPNRRYDLANRADRARVYEQVLAEGTEEDVRWFIDVDQLVELWPELVLPRHVRQAWAAWLKERRGVSLSC